MLRMISTCFGGSNLGISAVAGVTATSRTQSSGFTSSRKPTKTGARSLLSAVHEANFTEHTSSGFTQVISSRMSGRSLKGRVFVVSGCSRRWISRSSCWSNPEPTLPTHRNFFFSYTPSTSAPKYSRSPRV